MQRKSRNLWWTSTLTSWYFAYCVRVLYRNRLTKKTNRKTSRPKWKSTWRKLCRCVYGCIDLLKGIDSTSPSLTVKMTRTLPNTSSKTRIATSRSLKTWLTKCSQRRMFAYVFVLILVEKGQVSYSYSPMTLAIPWISSFSKEDNGMPCVTMMTRALSPRFWLEDCIYFFPFFFCKY